MQDLAPDAPVRLVGPGLTAVDVLISLRWHGHHGSVLGLLRQGWLPLSHLPRAVPPVSVDLPEGVGLPAALRRIREAARTALAHGQPWQAVLDA
ncbi:hypothetical protein [Teichococcus vastitatis]|uniref:Uncharacterized protein n=1 Tax=Teichococcus vastitatis TaxID=2307076 RepID=A0ABS9WAG6_9PROT|nr:hypothetical protein [Pseudoroseomonas vastitatis]MCI0756289.1 hypothetical protein [Pseudoroseomonas vastitatis]